MPGAVQIATWMEVGPIYKLTVATDNYVPDIMTIVKMFAKYVRVGHFYFEHMNLHIKVSLFMSNSYCESRINNHL